MIDLRPLRISLRFLRETTYFGKPGRYCSRHPCITHQFQQTRLENWYPCFCPRYARCFQDFETGKVKIGEHQIANHLFAWFYESLPGRQGRLYEDFTHAFITNCYNSATSAR